MYPLSKANHKSNWPARQRGAVAILLTIALVALLAMAGLALDGGHMLMNKTRLQNAVDAAALSGAKTLSQVQGTMNDGLNSAVAARNTLMLNASGADGNGELGSSIKRQGGISAFAQVEFSESVYGPFSFSQTLPENARYVRVTVPEYGLSEVFWGFMQSLSGSLGEKRVAAVAVAGPSPTAPCNLAPLLVCGDPNKKPTDTNFWGYEFGQLEVLKSTKWEQSGIGPGNFQLLDFGSGGKTLREALESGLPICYTPGQIVVTEPGNKVGPVRDGFNTRFEGATKDLVSDYNNPLLKYDDSFDPPVSHSGKQVNSNNGDLSTSSNPDLFDYNDWREGVAACLSGSKSCSGVADRRMLKIVIGDCSAPVAVDESGNNGKAKIPVLGFGCFFTLQPIGNSGGGAGNESNIFGQFVKGCNGDSYPSANPSTDKGPQIIQLYKSHVGNGAGVPSEDS